MDPSETKQFLYSIPCSQKREGETPIHRKPEQKDSLMDVTGLYPSLIEFWEQILSKHSELKAAEDYTFKEIDEMMKKVGSWLTENKHTNVFLYCKNCANWTITDVACWNYGINTIPLYDTLGPEAFDHIIKITEGTLIFTTKSLSERTFEEMNKNKYNVKEIVFFDEFGEQDKEKFESLGLIVRSFNDLLNHQNIVQKPKLSLDSHITYSFTSGTTGIPKGVVYTHLMVIGGVLGPANNNHWILLPTDVHISYLPIAHMYERYMMWACLYSGTNIQYCKLPPTEIVKQFARIKPTILPLVPRIINKFYPIVKGLYESQGNNLKVKGLFGGRVRNIIIGSAPVSPKILLFFCEVLECDLRQGYGQTETCAASFITFEGDKNYGSVGGPNACIEFKLIDVPEMNYLTSQTPCKGEVCIRGYPVFKEYFKNPEATKQIVDEDGWDHTGDIAELLPNGSIKIVDRKKNIYKLSQGEYVAPEKVENIYARVKYAAQTFVYGDSLRDYSVAIIHPNLEALPAIAKNLEIQETDPVKLCENESVTKFIHDEVLKQGKTDGLFGFQQAKRIRLWPVPFMKVGILTSTMKLQRYLAKKIFKEEIQKLYSLQQ